MSSRGSALLAIGTLVLGLVLGMLGGGVLGYFAGQNTVRRAAQNAPLFRQFAPNGPNNPNSQPNPVVPNPNLPNNPNNRNGRNNPNNPALPPTQNFANGALVTNVIADSPAAKAGLQVGDVITAVDNTKVDQNHSVSDMIQAHKPGDKVALTVTRESQTLTVNVELGPSAQNSSAAYLGIQFSSAPAGGGRQRQVPTPGGNLPNG